MAANEQLDMRAPLEEKVSRKKLKRNMSPKKRRAIHLMVSCGQNVNQTAHALNIKKDTIYQWLSKDKDFKRKYEDAYQRIEHDDVKYRVEQNKMITDSLYRSIQNKISNGEHEQLDLLQLCRLVREINGELRVDIPNLDKGKKKEKDGIEELLEDYQSDDGDGIDNLIEMPITELTEEDEDERRTEERVNSICIETKEETRGHGRAKSSCYGREA